jgi:exonuclease SbcD
MIPGPCPVHYCGSPLAIDFGEQDDTNVVLLVEATPGEPGRVTDLRITAGRRLRTVAGTVAELTARAAHFDGEFLRVVLREPYRAGLPEEVRAALPNVLVVRIDPAFATPVHRPSAAASHPATPAELFAAYCAERGIDDRRLTALFTRLHDEVTTAGAQG